MGLSLGGSTGGSSSKTQSQSSSTSTPTYTQPQSGLQQLLSQVLTSMLPATGTGGTSPQVQGIETQNADQINKTAAAGQKNLQRTFASRGFGQSGESGQVALQTELGREAALGNNLASGGSLQLQQNNSTLADALAYAFANPGQANQGQASGSGSSSSWGVGAGFGASIPH